MKAITQSAKAAWVFVEWARQYHIPSTRSGQAYWVRLHPMHRSYLKVYRRLRALLDRGGKFVTVEAVNRIVGNATWTQLICDECSQPVTEVAAFGYDGGAYKAHVCWRCLERARKLMKEVIYADKKVKKRNQRKKTKK